MALVKLFASLRAAAAGRKELHCPGADVGTVLAHLCIEAPDLRLLIFEDGSLRPQTIVTINGRTLDPQTCMGMPVSEGDEVAIFPPVGGG